MTTPLALQQIVDHVVWWEPARSQAKADLGFFLPYAMAYATDEELSLIRQHAADDQLRAALRSAPIGLFDLQSWQYWHTVLGVSPIPPRPRRAFLGGDAELDDRFSKCIPRSLPISA
jgi:hypothetical protein